MPHDDPETPAPAATAFEARRMDAIAFIAGSIAHDIANPLAAMHAFASSLVTDARLPRDVHDNAELLRLEAETTQRLVGALLEIVRTRPPVRTAVAMEEVVADVLDACRPALGGIVVDRDFAPDLPRVETDPSRIRHLVLVLVVDAIRGLGLRPAAARLRIAATAVASAGVHLVIEFEREPGRAATGPVRSADDAVRAAASLGGRLATAATAAGGRAVLELPVGSATRGPGAPSGMVPTAARTPVTIPVVLVCDDEEVLRTVVVSQLGRRGIDAREAAGGHEAMDVLQRMPVDVVLADHHLADMTGVELYLLAVAIRPELRGRFVLMSGDPGATELVDLAREHGVPVLAKPFDMDALAATVREIVAR